MSNQAESSTTSFGGESRKRKRSKVDKLIDDRTAVWRSDSNQQIYSTKLLDALRHVSSTSSSSNPRNIRAAADRALAATAKGRTRWSRSILKHHRRRLHLHSRILKKVSKKNPNDKLAASTNNGGSRLTRESRRTEAVEKRVRVLGRLVPGCGKLSFPSLLEETTDYIAALKMQVKAMARIAQILTGAEPSLPSAS